MFDKIKELVNKSDVSDKSELVTFLESLETPKIPSLEEINTKEEFAELKKTIDKREGELRGKWDAEAKAKAEEIRKAEEEKNKVKVAVPPITKDNAVLEEIKKLNEKITNLENGKIADARKKTNLELANSKIVNLSDFSKKRILASVNEDTTEEQLNEIVKDFNEYEISLKPDGQVGDPDKKLNTNEVSFNGKKAAETIAARLPKD